MLTFLFYLVNNKDCFIFNEGKLNEYNLRVAKYFSWFFLDRDIVNQF